MTDPAYDDATIRTVRHPSCRACSLAPICAPAHPQPRATHPGTTPPSTPDPAPITALPDVEPTEHQPARPLLYTPEQAAALLQVRTSWLRRKATARAVPCRFVGKHLRFSLEDIHTIADTSAPPSHRPRHSPTN